MCIQCYINSSVHFTLLYTQWSLVVRIYLRCTHRVKYSPQTTTYSDCTIVGIYMFVNCVYIYLNE